MGICPKCGAQLNKLLMQEDGVKLYSVRLDKDKYLDFEEIDYQSLESQPFVCPECNEEVAETDEQAIDILNDKVETVQEEA